MSFTTWHRRYNIMALVLLLAISAGVGVVVLSGGDVNPLRAAPIADTQVVAAVPGEAQWTPIATLPVGTAEGQVAYRLDVCCGTPTGPRAFAVAPGGTIYLLDTLQQRVHAIAGGKVVKTIQLPFASFLTDIVATTDGMYILDDGVLHVSYDGALIEKYLLPQDVSVHSLYVNRDGRIMLWTHDYREFELESLPASIDLGAETETAMGKDGPSLRGFTAPDGRRWRDDFEGKSDSHVAITDGSILIPVGRKNFTSFVQLLGFDQAAQPYVLVGSYDNNGELQEMEQTVRRYDLTGQMTGVARLPIREFAYRPDYPLDKPVEVAWDGTLFVMVPKVDGLTIYHVVMGQLYPSQVTPEP